MYLFQPPVSCISILAIHSLLVTNNFFLKTGCHIGPNPKFWNSGKIWTWDCRPGPQGYPPQLNWVKSSTPNEFSKFLLKFSMLRGLLFTCLCLLYILFFTIRHFGFGAQNQNIFFAKIESLLLIRATFWELIAIFFYQKEAFKD